MLLMLSEKGKYASATENRKKRDEICIKKNVDVSTTSRGLVSLMQKEILLKEDHLYSIHFRLIPYMRLKADCDYATAIHLVAR
jgi:hypothetical protein